MGRKLTSWWLLAAVAGFAAVLIAGGQRWAQIMVDDDIMGQVAVPVTGNDVAAGALAGALLGGAGVVAGAAGSWSIKRVAAVALVAGGLLAGFSIANFVRDPAAASASAIAERTALTGQDAAATASLELSVWPMLSAVGAALLLLGGLQLWWHARTARMSQRTGARPAREQNGRQASTWDQLSAGEDPTDRPT